MIITKFLSLLKRYKTDLPTFTIVGVGPGDPSLLTIAAVDAIKKAKVIVFPISDDTKKSFAAEIVNKYTKYKKNIPIIFPMARQDFDPNEIWSNAVKKIVKFGKEPNPVFTRDDLLQLPTRGAQCTNKEILISKNGNIDIEIDKRMF